MNFPIGMRAVPAGKAMKGRTTGATRAAGHPAGGRALLRRGRRVAPVVARRAPVAAALDDVAGPERALAAAAGESDREMGHGEAAPPPPRALHDRDPLRERRAQML